VADNIANIATDGYRAQRVEFEELLADQEAPPVPAMRTHRAHLPVDGGLRGEAPQVVEQDSGYDNGVNDVDIDREMVGLAENELMYRMTTRLLNARYQGLRTAITGRTS
jgi:flagellar basal-body rod protein FlgB